MPKPLPTPPTPPSARANRLLATIDTLVNQSDRAQAVVDLLHVESKIRDELDPAIFRAIDSEYGGTPYRRLAALCGLALGAVQKRFDDGELIVRGFRKPRRSSRSSSSAPTDSTGQDDTKES